MTKKLLIIVGITGNQGGSVAAAFASDPSYRIRGLSRNPSSPAAKALSEKGIEIVQADLDDVASIEKAFERANLIFSITNYWEPFFRPDCRVPLGPWTKDPALKELGHYERCYMIDSVEAHSTALYTRVWNYSANQAKITFEMIKQEFNNKNLHLYTGYMFMYGMKPDS